MYRADPRSSAASATGNGTVYVGREVIIAGGSYNTPQLLKLSGVGPSAELESFGIPVLVNLPGVGTNLQDRYEQTIIAKASSNFSLINGCTFMKTADDPCLKKWQTGLTQDLKGVYASNGIALGVIKRSSVAAAAGDTDPDLIITGGPAVFKGYYPGWSDAALVEHDHWSWIVLKGHTKNYNAGGTVKLRSADPRDTPVINFNSFDGDGGDNDLAAVVEGLKWARRAFADVIPLDGSFAEEWPGTNVSSDDALSEYTRDEAWGHHASCTCPIGADGDANAVLDTNFKVRGTSNLRVVDASIFPRIPGFVSEPPSQACSHVRV